jgi:hypothetical protein
MDNVPVMWNSDWQCTVSPGCRLQVNRSRNLVSCATGTRILRETGFRMSPRRAEPPRGTRCLLTVQISTNTRTKVHGPTVATDAPPIPCVPDKISVIPQGSARDFGMPFRPGTCGESSSTHVHRQYISILTLFRLFIFTDKIF